MFSALTTYKNYSV